MTPKVKHFLICLVICVCHCHSSGQSEAIDSLIKVLAHQQDDSTKVKTLSNLSYTYWQNGDWINANKYANDVIALVDKLLSKTKDPDRQFSIKKSQATSYSIIGIYYEDQGNYPEALKSHFAALAIREKIGDKTGIASSYNNIGSVFTDQKDYPNALKYNLSSLKMRKEIGAEKKALAFSYNNIGNIYVLQNNYSEALKNHREALQLMKESGDTTSIGASYHNMGDVYNAEGDYLAKNGNNSAALEKYSDALMNYKAAFRIFEEHQSKMIVYSYIALGRVYTRLKNYTQARKYLTKGLGISKERKAKERIKDCYSVLTDLDSAEGNWRSAFENHKMFITYRDSLTNEENTKKTVQAQMNYEFDKKEAIASAVHRNELDKQQAIAEEKSRKQKIVIWSVIGGLLLVAIFAAFIFRSLRITRRQKHLIELQKSEVDKQKHIIEEKNKDITDSISYAQSIQKAMLPHRSDIWATFPNSFVLFKPKDIVSGDFYFFHKNYTTAFIAAADCTGHGVPGGFMSMVGTERLTDAVHQSNDTSEVLSLLNKGVKTSLKQTKEKSTSREGMDIALCSVDTHNSIIKYAGANRPLYIVRSGQAEIEEIKATKKAIGGFTEDNQHYDTHEILLQQGDTFYLSTDGYGDTFGGEKIKKLTTKRFKQILLEIQQMTMKEQEHYLDNFIENWKDGMEQVDDILVIGIRL